MSFHCMLKKTKIRLQLLSDYEMLLMFEKGIREDWGRRASGMRRQTIRKFQIMMLRKKNRSWCIRIVIISMVTR
ncbi:unnamed protein product [Macrosiphum euphorbiae]|uniref:Uncharacterized protein n=1 Tax=Macrosiphum euphorbiae TaxID=13131 RepID=A0AAV0WQT3_9HEMI|nr:unnamed protein product [Macrosiphum euphorbiae]